MVLYAGSLLTDQLSLFFTNVVEDYLFLSESSISSQPVPVVTTQVCMFLALIRHISHKDLFS